MTKILEITATTTDAEIEAAIPFLDMCEFAKDRRDDATVIYEVNGEEETVLELFEIDGAIVLWDAAWASGYVNETSRGVGDSLPLENDQVESPEEAVEIWRSGWRGED